MLDITLPSPCERFTPDWKYADDVDIYVKRDDLIHPVISGNKWRKLKYALSELPDGMSRTVSFGGGYSNHLHALGYACQQLAIPFTAIVRGDYSASPTPMLMDLLAWNCELVYVNKLEYRQRETPAYLKQIRMRYPNAVIIPEGGKQPSALKGVGEIIDELTFQPDYILLPVGSGATLAGLIPKLNAAQHAIGIAVLKGENYLETEVESLLTKPHTNWRIEHKFHQGGYAKHSPELVQFCQALFQNHGIATEPVYTGKLFYAAKTLIENCYFQKGAKILLIHTGGLQGARKIKTDETN
ncbi:pyridoxal-phosphate dependent enzyme [Alteromonas ponticola]|uniref:Pyridoxal-phosphate dependent enzyme n=1 Tax=Alteromonas aquimaris TaxID=2998417 RepID=A0ABT3P2K3_9ALTE|nr:pyridoxal-phosphate dependent enzyme [Alteromonas aquimaris]MCW8106994.1 pyridoxal-phosphate dependent enzyme [Alteromonas aquimaris]